MIWLARLVSALGALFDKTRTERDLDDELRAYLEAATEEKAAQGMGREEAARAARVEIGSVAAIKDRVRDVGWESALASSWQDVRYGLRMLRRSPAFAATATTILALAIGATTAIFSLVDVVMLRELPVRAPHELFQVSSRYPGEPRAGFPWKSYEHFRDHNTSFSDLIALSPTRFDVSRTGPDVENVDGAYVTGNLFPTLGLEPAVGRLITPEDDRVGSSSAAAVVVSWSYWDSRLNRDPSVVGSRLVVSGVPATVIGVAPRSFFGLIVGASPDLWVPVAMEPLVQHPSRLASGQLGIGIIGRLQPGASVEQARADMAGMNQWRIDEIARTSKDPLLRLFTIEVVPAATGFSRVRDLFGKPLTILMIAAALLLSIACTNVASMLLARSTSRRREMAVRVSLGAGRLRLLRQVLIESLLLALGGALIGVVLAYLGAQALVNILASGRPVIGLTGPMEIAVHPDLRVLLFTAGTALVTGVLFGLAPAWQAFASAPMSSLRDATVAGETRSRRLFAKALVVTQVALSVVLLTAAGLFVQHLSNLRNVGLGFDRHSVLLVSLDPARSGYERTQLSGSYEDLLGRLATIPGVRSATLAGATPIHGAGASRFVDVEGVQEEPNARRYVAVNWVGPKYFATFGTPLYAGRDFALEDDGARRVAIVNHAMARHYFGDASPLGKRFTFDGRPTQYEIIGVVGDAKYTSIHEPAPRTIYLNAFQDAGGASHQFALRTDVRPMAVVGEVRRLVRDVLPNVPVAKVTTLSDQVDASIVPERLVAMLSALFGGLAVTLAAVGLYGLLAYTVARRIDEIGVRMALGATERDVIRMVLRGALGLVGAGLVLGIPVAIWGERIAASLVPNLRVSSAIPIGFAGAAMVVLALIASYVPAQRAARVQPMDALRHS